MQHLVELIPEVEDFFYEADFERQIKYLAMQFGEDTTLKSLNEQIEHRRRMPTKTVGGKEYVAGYRGPLMVMPGQHNAVLGDVVEHGRSFKFIFLFGGAFLYYTRARAEVPVIELIDRAKNVGKTFEVTVTHEVIANTGQYHAVVSDVIWDTPV
jgi:hypothetical protein